MNKFKTIAFGVVGVTLVLFVLAGFSCNTETKAQSNTPVSDTKGLQEGDIVFQVSQSRQCKAVQAATHSKFSHCGILLKHDGKLMVYEAVGPVIYTPFEEWITHGKDNYYLVKRLKDSAKLTAEVLKTMHTEADKYAGLPYDIYFGWSDERIYCSELVWKIYKDATGIEVGKLQLLKDFDLSDPLVQTIMKERYGNKVPYGEKVISPGAITESTLLETVVGKE